MEDVASLDEVQTGPQIANDLALPSHCKQYLDAVLVKLHEIIPFDRCVLSEDALSTKRLLLANFIACCLHIYFVHNAESLQALRERGSPRPDQADPLRWMHGKASWNFNDAWSDQKPRASSDAPDPLRVERADETRSVAKPAPEPSHNLTSKEREVLQWIVQGKTSKETGMILSIAERTVKFHLRNIYSKLNVVNRAQAVTVASRLRLV
jgi:DNA-binding CsgD family transcriptional regulator